MAAHGSRPEAQPLAVKAEKRSAPWSQTAAGGTNGTVAEVTGSGDAYTVTVTATGQGNVTIAFAGSVADPAGNTKTTAGGTDRTVTYDTIAPALTIAQAAGQADPTNVATIRFTLTGNEDIDPATVTAADFTVVNGAAPTITGSGRTLTVTTVAAAEGAVSITVSPDFSVSDIAGNATDGATVLADTSVVYDRDVTYDVTAPTVTLEQAADQVDPAKGDTIRFTLSSNENLQAGSVTAADFEATNATGVTVIIVEQNAMRCLQIVDRGYVLDQGRNAYTGTGRDLATDPKVVQLYLGTLAKA